MTRATLLLSALLLGIGVGCSDKLKSKQQSQLKKAQSDALLQELMQRSGAVFPTGTRVITHDDGGGRDSSHGFYQWVLFSASPIKIPLPDGRGGENYVKLPLANTVQSVEIAMNNRRIAQPQSAIASIWQTNRYEFRSTTIRTPTGDYVLIEQFLTR